MARYTFTCEHFDYDIFRGDEEHASSTHTTEFKAGSLDTVLENFESFLRGAGFHFTGVLDIVKPDEEIESDNRWDFSGIPQNNFPFVSTPESNDITLDLGAAQPALSFPLNDDVIQFPTEASERCPICKIPKSVMKSEKCYDNQCPKTSWLMDLDYKLASEK